MPIPPAEQQPRSVTGTVVRLSFRRRPAPPRAIDRSPPFVLEADGGRWTLHGEPLDAAGLVAAADALREVARALVEQAHAEAGQPSNRCLAEFVLYQDGGIDHWLTASGDGADRQRIVLGLRNALSSLCGGRGDGR